MHSNKISLAILVDEKPLFEKKGSVYLPYGSNYSLLIKNNNSFDIVAKVSLDMNFSNDSFIVKAKSKRVIRGFSYEDLFYSYRFVEETEKINQENKNKIERGCLSVTVFNNDLPPHETFPFRMSEIALNSGNKTIIDENKLNNINLHYDNIVAVTNTLSLNSIPNVRTESLKTEYKEEKHLGGMNVFGEPINEKEDTIIKSFLFSDSIGVFHYKLKGRDEEENLIKRPILAKDNVTCTICETKASLNDKYCSHCGSFIVFSANVIDTETSKKICCGKVLNNDFKYCPYCTKPA